MCGGGGGGGIDATTRALQEQQMKLAREDELRRKAEDLRQGQAKNYINALYGVDPTEIKSEIGVDEYKKALVENYGSNHQAPNQRDFYTVEKAIDMGTTDRWGNGKPYNQQVANKDAYNTALNQFQINQNRYVNDGMSKFKQDQGATSADSAKHLAARNAGYDQVKTNSLNFMNEDINRNREDAARSMRFGLARSGLTGGSVDIDENANLTDANQRSTVQANQLADNQVQQIKADDEATRAELIGKITAGLDADSAATTAAQRMQNNREQAISAPPSHLMDNLFAGVGNFWNSAQYSQGAANPYGSGSGIGAIGSSGGYKGRLS